MKRMTTLPSTTSEHPVLRALYLLHSVSPLNSLVFTVTHHCCYFGNHSFEKMNECAKFLQSNFTRVIPILTSEWWVCGVYVRIQVGPLPKNTHLAMPHMLECRPRNLSQTVRLQKHGDRIETVHVAMSGSSFFIVHPSLVTMRILFIGRV